MEQDQTASGSAGGSASSATEDQTKQQNQNQGGDSSTGTTDKKDSKLVPWDSHKRALDDLNKEKAARRELEAKLGDFESKSLQEKNDFKGLYEREKAAREKAEAEAKSVKGWFTQTQRFNAVQTEALKAGLLPQAAKDLELLEMDGVEVEVTSTGRALVSGAKDFVERVKNDRPYWFQKPGAPNVNGGGGGTPPPEGKELTPGDVYQAERNWKAGKITRTEYEQVNARYLAQVRKKT